MEHQLAERYMKDNQRCSHGLNLVGWYNCDRWETTDYRQRKAPKIAIEKAREKLNAQAASLTDSTRPSLPTYVRHGARKELE